MVQPEEGEKAKCVGDPRAWIITWAALEHEDGMCATWGIGIPLLPSNYISPDVTIHLHRENGILGFLPFPLKEEVDADLITAGEQTVTISLGSCFFSHEDSSVVIRGDTSTSPYWEPCRFPVW